MQNATRLTALRTVRLEAVLSELPHERRLAHACRTVCVCTLHSYARSSSHSPASPTTTSLKRYA